MEAIKITEKSAEVFNYVKNNGGRVSVEEICEATGRAPRSINANVTDLAKKGLVIRDKVAGEGEDAKDITYVVLTDEGAAFVPATDAE
jgi:DNA-binding MarR family transcriptional regulator